MPLGAMQALPPDNSLESLVHPQIHRSQSLRAQNTMVAWSGHVDRNYKFLAAAVRKHIEKTIDGLRPAMPCTEACQVARFRSPPEV